MKAVLAAVPLVFILAATACGGNDPVAEEADNVASLNAVVAEANAAANAVHEEAEAEGSDNRTP